MSDTSKFIKLLEASIFLNPDIECGFINPIDYQDNIDKLHQTRFVHEIDPAVLRTGLMGVFIHSNGDRRPIYIQKDVPRGSVIGSKLPNASPKLTASGMNRLSYPVPVPVLPDLKNGVSGKPISGNLGAILEAEHIKQLPKTDGSLDNWSYKNESAFKNSDEQVFGVFSEALKRSYLEGAEFMRMAIVAHIEQNGSASLKELTRSIREIPAPKLGDNKRIR